MADAPTKKPGAPVPRRARLQVDDTSFTRNMRYEFADAEGFLDIVISARIEGRDFFGLLIACRKHDDRYFRKGPYRLDDVLAVAIGQAEIEHDQCRRAHRRKALGRCHGFRGLHLEIRCFQRRAQEALNLRFVVDDEDSRFHLASPARGSRTTKRVPRRRMAGLSALIVPPMAVIRPRAMARPSPVPAGRPSPLARR